MSGQARDPRGRGSVAVWESIHAHRDQTDLSWYEERPDTSVSLVCRDGVPGTVVDVGAGAATLPDALLDAGVEHVTLVGP